MPIFHVYMFTQLFIRTCKWNCHHTIRPSGNTTCRRNTSWLFPNCKHISLFHVVILIFHLSSLGKNTELYSMQLKNLLQMKRILIINRFNKYTFCDLNKRMIFVSYDKRSSSTEKQVVMTFMIVIILVILCICMCGRLVIRG